MSHDQHNHCCAPSTRQVEFAAPISAQPGTAGAPTHRLLLRIDNMDCPTEEGLIRNRLASMPGILQLEFNLLQRQLTVTHSLDATAPIHAALRALDMRATVVSEHGPQRAASLPLRSRRQWWLLGVGAVAALLAEILAWTLADEGSWPVIGLALLAIAASGTGTYRKGWIALKHGNLNINALMTIAVTGALAIGQWPEAAMVMVLFTVAEMIEAQSLQRARHAIADLMALAPPQATVRQPDGTWRVVDIAGVMPGAVARVAPGERVALDGVLSAGQSTLNQAPITGESLPVEKTVGDPVFAGSINQTGSFEYRVTATANDSTLARIIHAVENAQLNRAPTQRFVDRFARIYTPLVLVLALAVALCGPLIFGLAWSAAAYQALVLLVIACPCALVVSTPVTIVSALAAAAQGGILIKGGVFLEQGKDIRALALDKTGTLTHGRLRVTDVVPLAGSGQQNLQLAAALAARSDHPASVAISAYWHAQEADGGGNADRIEPQQHADNAQDKDENNDKAESGGNEQSAGNQRSVPAVVHFSALLGRGVQGEVAGRRYHLGNHRLVEQLGICNAATEAALGLIEAQGKSALVLCDDSLPLLVIGVADTVRASSGAAIAELHALGVHTVMLTGDNQQTAQAIAQQVGIDDARGELLPDDKLAAIRELLARHGTVGMVGDGINDAPALAQASIGFAMGAAGSDSALETADVALMDDDLRKLASFIRLSRKTAAVLKQNIALALAIKAVFMLLALFGMATLWMAVFADMGASLLVVLNGLRLLRSSPAANQKTRAWPLAGERSTAA